MPRYVVEFSIDIEDAQTPRIACEEAWETLTAPDSLLPIGTVIDEEGERTNIDLSLDEDYHPHDLECVRCGVTLNNQCLTPECGEEEDHRGTVACGSCVDAMTPAERRAYLSDTGGAPG